MLKDKTHQWHSLREFSRQFDMEALLLEGSYFKIIKSFSVMQMKRGSWTPSTKMRKAKKKPSFELWNKVAWGWSKVVGNVILFLYGTALMITRNYCGQRSVWVRWQVRRNKAPLLLLSAHYQEHITHTCHFGVAKSSNRGNFALVKVRENRQA